MEFRFHKDQTADCLCCGKCCGAWPVPVSRRDADRLEKHHVDPAMFRKGFLRKVEGLCVFLEQNHHCSIHEKFGFAAKPLACRLYPFDLVNWKDGTVSVSLRHDCPGVGTGKKMAAHLPLIAELAEEMRTCGIPPAFALYAKNSSPGLPRLREIAETYHDIFVRDVESELKIYAAAQLLNFHSRPENVSDIQEADSFRQDAAAFVERSLDVLRDAIACAGTPTRATLTELKFITAYFLRNDHPGISLSERVRNTLRTIGFIYGPLPLTVNGKEIPFRPRNVTESDRNFYIRYLSGRVEAMHFCGTAFRGLTFVEGMRCLLAGYFVFLLLVPVFGAEKSLELLDGPFLRTALFARRDLRNMTNRLIGGADLPELLRTFSE